ncbi:hypothetical protein BBG47_01105 [Paenibacillus sp. KS1]|uniref:hypothetical protein n=1 Tax=Paenibacillus sp. KS1 TaxID=1849249 RepID=UPI0008066892|nr:hypothetical protein [Paenibacillus sp. KS1]OBY81426.1 hypothetical protein BBG47_01105 [Paenibacillus sp. KS1]
MRNLLTIKPIKYSILIILLVLIVTGGFYLRNKLLLNSLDSTNLSNLTISGINLNQNIKDVDLSVYKKRNDFDDKVTGTTTQKYFEDFSVIHDNSGKILTLKTMNRTEKGIEKLGNGVIVNLSDVTNLLGSHYIEKGYDSAQGLYSRIYYDKENKVKATFVFPKMYLKDDKNPEAIIIWVILERY